jgi:hypothetical protein
MWRNMLTSGETLPVSVETRVALGRQGDQEMILSGNIFGKRKDYLATSSIWGLAEVLMLTPRLTGLNLCINGEAAPPH